MTAQTRAQLEEEVELLVLANKSDLALEKVKKLYNVEGDNKNDTSLNFAQSLEYLGNVCFNNSNNSALKYLNQSLLLFKKQNRTIHPDVARIHYSLSMYYYHSNNLEMSLNEIEKSLNVLNKLNYSDFPFCIYSIDHAGLLYYKKENYFKSELLYELELSIFKTNVDKRIEIDSNLYNNALFNLAGVYLCIGKNSEAIPIYKEVIESHRRSNGTNNIDYVRYICDLGSTYHAAGKYSEADFNYNQALRISRNLLKSYTGTNEDSLKLIPHLLNNLFTLNMALGNYERASGFLKEACELEPKNYIYIRNAGMLAYHFGDYKSALTLMEESANIIIRERGKNNLDFADIIQKLATFHEMIGNYKKAESLIKESCEIIKKILGENSNEYYWGLHYLASLYANMGDFLKAKPIYEEVYKFRKAHMELDKQSFHLVIYELANVCAELKDLHNAEIYYNEFVSLSKIELAENFKWLSEKEKESYFEILKPQLNRIENFVVTSSQNLPSSSEIGYNVNLIAKAIQLDSQRDFNREMSNTKDSVLKANYIHLKSLRNYRMKITSETSENLILLSKLQQQIDSLDQLLSRKMITYSDYKQNFSLTWKDIQSNLNNNEASIEFSRYYDYKDTSYHYIAWLVKSGDKYPQLVKLCSESQLVQFSPESELNELYNLLWKPIFGQLTGIKTIYYTPAGLINNIPLQALYLEKDGVKEYLMDKFSLNQLISTRYLALGLKQKEQEPIAASIALFGGVDYEAINSTKTDEINAEDQSSFILNYVLVSRGNKDSLRSGFEYLPGTKKEVEDIALILKQNKWDVSIATEKNASENSIKSFSEKNSKSILHIATHGFAIAEKIENIKKTSLERDRGYERYTASDNPMIRSGLLLSGANWTWQGKGDTLLKMTNEDGILTASELSQLDLSKTKLVALSACQTGKGAIQGSEGTFGLKRALKLAGVENMIVSLWDVPDEPTMEMMTLFYTELANTKKPVSSFETAQKAMRFKYPNEPKMWAGFVFVR